MYKHGNVIAALILSAALLGSAWMVSQNGRYAFSSQTPMAILDTRTGVVCVGPEPSRRGCFDPHNGVGFEQPD